MRTLGIIGNSAMALLGAMFSGGRELDPIDSMRSSPPMARSSYRGSSRNRSGGYVPAGRGRNINQEGECARRIEQMAAGTLTRCNNGPDHLRTKAERTKDRYIENAKEGWKRLKSTGGAITQSTLWPKIATNVELPIAAAAEPQLFDPERAKSITEAGQAILRENMAAAGRLDAPFKVGDSVIWASSGVRKLGKITHVVPAGKMPADVGAKVKDPSTTPRDHESFVVAAIREDQDFETAKPVNYWPRVASLSHE